jgi:3-phosphoshikimate 1-carboxyvinyltransferase
LAGREGFTIENVGINPTRTGVLDILRLMGAGIRVHPRSTVGTEPVADLEITATSLKGIRVPESLVPLAIDEFPVLFIAAACAQGETTVSGAAELRVKESDRLAVMAEGLGRMGIVHELAPDGIRIAGNQRFSGGVVDSHGDHRIAMAFAVASLASNAPITIRDTANVRTSFPTFVETARLSGLQISAA